MKREILRECKREGYTITFTTFRKNRFYCSRECQKPPKLGPYELICDICGYKFISRTCNARLCSADCKSPAIKRECVICFNQFETRRPNRNVCSEICKKRKLQHRTLPFIITSEEYERLLLVQDGRCAICRNYETRLGANGGIVRLSVDHDHRTGEVRGLLCMRCNLGVGHINDNPEIALSIVSYLNGSCTMIDEHF